MFHAVCVPGALPESLTKLTALEHLYLGDNNLTGLIPSGIAEFPFLRELSVENTGLEGTCAAIAAASNVVVCLLLTLTHICHLHRLRPTGIAGPAKPPQLRHIHVKQFRRIHTQLEYAYTHGKFAFVKVQLHAHHHESTSMSATA